MQPPFSRKMYRRSSEKFPLDVCQTHDTPKVTNSKMEANGPGPSVNKIMYRGIIGSLLYLTISRPNTVLIVGMCARFQSFPKDLYLKIAKRILRYLKKTWDPVLLYPLGGSLYMVMVIMQGTKLIEKNLRNYSFSWVVSQFFGY